MKQSNNETIKIELTLDELLCVNEMIEQYLEVYVDDDDIDDDLRNDYENVCSKLIETYNVHFRKINKKEG